MYLISKPVTPRNKIWQLALYLIGCLLSIVILVSGLDSIHKLFGSSTKAQAKPEGGEGNILRLKIDNLNPQCSTDSELSSPSELASSVPYTPECKGFPFETNFLDELRGERRYFIASIQLNQGRSEYSTFSLDPGQRKISHISESSPLEHVDRSFDSVINFTIDDLTYQWDTIFDTLLVGQPQAGPGTPITQWSDVQLYTTLEKAKELVDSIQCANLGAPSSSNLVSSPPADSNTTSPSNIADDPPTFPETEVFYLPHAMGYFGPSPSKDHIDEWVDQAVSNHQAPRNGTRLKCPEAGCTSISRRPHALKTHLYTHYRIKPLSCRICDLSVLTKANLVRHMKNAHTCSGCHVQGPAPYIKSHKNVCPLDLFGRNARRNGRTRSSLGIGAASRLKF